MTFPFSMYYWRTVHPSCTTMPPHHCLHHCTAAICIAAICTLPPQWPPLGSPTETPREVRLCMEMTWHLPHDYSCMYIIAPGVGTEEAAFFSSSHFSLSGQGRSPCDGAAAMHSCFLPHQVPSARCYTGTLPLLEPSLTAGALASATQGGALCPVPTS